jgi:membrane-bound serine protease (ClpP class)
MTGWLLFAVFLYVACTVLLVAEVFIPSGGLISLCALACLVGGVSIFFRHSATSGWIGIGIAVVLIPSVLIITYRILPQTRFGRAVTLMPPQRTQGDAIPDTEQLQSLLGTTGRVITPLRPVGMCDFSGQRLECVAESGYVDKGKNVEVIRVQGTQLTVRIKDET